MAGAVGVEHGERLAEQRVLLGFGFCFGLGFSLGLSSSFSLGFGLGFSSSFSLGFGLGIGLGLRLKT